LLNSVTKAEGDVMSDIIGIFMSLIMALGAVFQAVPYAFSPVIEFDLNSAEQARQVSSYACGFLYGLAQPGVPSKEVVDSLEISSVSQKVAGGLQHPVGDVDDVSENLYGCDYIVVYLQDCYDTWYYCNDEINELRKAGTYNCEEFVETSFIPKVKECVSAISGKDYAGRIVYCPYNECDNAVWFGSESDSGWPVFDDAAKARFYSAWAKTYKIIKSIHPGCRIGGPGYCDFDLYEITDFLEFCKANNCLPDVMIYHELNPESSMWFRDHVEEYRQAEKACGIEELPMIVTEYGTMEECGAPSAMLHYITAMEETGVYGNVAFWRLADNLCDTCAKGNLPNSNWWLYKWYSDMEGALLSPLKSDLLHSDFENTIKYARKRFHKSTLDGIGSFNGNGVQVICGGVDYDYQVVLKGLKSNIKSDRVKVTVEAVTYEGLSGAVFAPVVIEEKAVSNSPVLKVKIGSPDKNAVYHITVSPYCGEKLRASDTLPARFEFEKGELIGKSYTYDSAYATTGETAGMCGGFEKPGDGISLDFDVSEEGEYELSVVYGKSNDGVAPADRADARVIMEFDGRQREISLPNTVKSEYTDKYIFRESLEPGRHNIKLMHGDGTFVVDSLLVKKAQKDPQIYSQYEKEKSAYLIIVPSDGYYSVNGNKSVYLKAGLNYLKSKDEGTLSIKPDSRPVILIDFSDVTLSGTAEIRECAGRNCICGIDSNSGSARFNYSAAKDGLYALTVTYSNNEEGGVHAYNVDLIEEYITVESGSGKYELWCVNTMSSSFNTAVVYIELTRGDNIITLSNDGHNKFNGRVATSPCISGLSVCPAEVIYG